MIRVATYNVSGGLDPLALAEVLRPEDPDLCCVLEAPAGGRLRRLAAALGLEVAIRSGRRGQGTAVLVRPDLNVLSTSEVSLSTPRQVPRREASHAIVSRSGQRLSVTAVQLGLRPEVRRTNLDELLAFLASVDAPSIVGGDLNEPPHGPVASELAARYQDAHAVGGHGAGLTYPTADPTRRQDYIFVDPALRIVACRTLATDPVRVAGHHRPVVVELAPAETPESP